MVDEDDLLLGLAVFSRFHLEGKYADELLLLSPVAVKPPCSAGTFPKS